MELETSQFIELLKKLKEMAGRYSTKSRKRVFIIATSMEDPDYLISVLMKVPGVMIFVYYLNDLLTNPKVVEKAWTLNNYFHKQNFAWSGFIFEGHIASMISEKQQGTYIKLCAVLLLTMPGTPVFYYGDEIALKDYKESKYPLMRWDKSKYAGFANSVPWISPAYTPVYTPTVNQQSEDPLSTLSFYRTLGKMRIEEQPLQYGDFSVMLNTTNILAYVRQWHETGILVILNFGGAVTYDFTALNLPPTAVLLAKSTNLTQCELIHLQTMVIEANVGYVLRYFKVE
ncbi:4F2 cell-surface antigen heavy chain-like isoform X2 [Mobula hypostoma]|uniref:4F2 cell-surface antigen heavy chain-like isoform X2 n=1 Tax=Mobula hypostoma TaxID=723540 RepID=UPI002FC2FFC0